MLLPSRKLEKLRPRPQSLRKQRRSVFRLALDESSIYTRGYLFAAVVIYSVATNERENLSHAPARAGVLDF